MDNSNRSINTTYADSFNTSTNTETAGDATNSSAGTFGAGSIVATSALSNYVTGNHVTFGGAAGQDGVANNSLTTGNQAFQNFAGMQSLNVNTGAAASQSSNVSVAVSAPGATIR